MSPRFWMAAITASVMLATSLAGTDPGDCSKFAPPNHLYKDVSGKYCCARHRRPLITAHVFSLPSPLPLIEFEGEMRRLSDCNPNSLYPHASLHRTNEFSESGVLDYCPECQRAVLAALARFEADYQAHHH